MRSFIYGIIVFIALVFSVSFIYAEEIQQRPVTIYFFWGEGCPHCKHEKAFLNKMKLKYPNLHIKEYEVWYHQENLNIYRHIASAYGETSGNVPATFIDVKSWLGYSEDKAFEIEQTIQECFKFSCLDALEVANKAAENAKKKAQTTLPKEQNIDKKTTIPFIGTVNIEKVSLPLLTIILAGLDGFNPCAFFVLLMLLSLMVHAQSRMKMLIVGGVFVFFSGFVYFLFMAAWLNIFMMTSKIGFITFIAGLLAVVMASINIKDFFFFKKGVSLTISEKDRTSLITKMRQLIQTGSTGALLLGTITLAFMANLYELLCTAGFPMVFTRALTLQQLPVMQYYLYLILYNLIYILPLLTIVLVFVFTLGTRKLTEQEGRNLKLLSGLMMLSLGGILLFKPALLNNIVVSIGLIVGVILIGGLIIWLNKKNLFKKVIGIFIFLFLGLPLLSLEAKETKIKVITTLFPTYDFVKQIAKDKVDVSLLLPAGVEPHSFEPKAKDIVRMNEVDIFIYTGEHMEPWSKKILQGLSNKKVFVVDVSQGIPLISFTGNERDADHDFDHDEDDYDSLEYHDEEDTHHHADKDPHIWLDLNNAQKMVETILQALIKVDPINKDFYLLHGREYQQKLKELDERLIRILSTAQHKTILYGGHFAFGYFAKRYGLQHESPYKSFSPNAEPSPKAIIELMNKLKDSKKKYIYHEELIDPKVARMIAEETHTTLEVLHAAHNISQEELKQGITFLDLMESNLKKLIVGLDCRENND